MSRLRNRKYTTQVLSGSELVTTDDGRVIRANRGDTLLVDQSTGKVTVKTPAMMASDTETVLGVVRDKSPQFTAQTLTAPASVSAGSDGSFRRGNPGDILLTNNATGEVRIVRAQDYVQQYE